MGVGSLWFGVHIVLYFGSGIVLGFVLALSVRKYRGPPVRWELEEVE